MRPTPEEIIDGLDYSLQQEIRPELSSEWSLRVADAMTWALRHLKARWLHERDVVLAELSELSDVLTETRSRNHFEHVDWTALDTEIDSAQPLSSLIAHTMQLRATLNQVIEALPAESMTGDSETWTAVLQYLQNQIDREESLLYPDQAPPEGRSR